MSKMDVTKALKERYDEVFEKVVPTIGELWDLNRMRATYETGFEGKSAEEMMNDLLTSAGKLEVVELSTTRKGEATTNSSGGKKPYKITDEDKTKVLNVVRNSTTGALTKSEILEQADMKKSRATATINALRKDNALEMQRRGPHVPPLYGLPNHSGTLPEPVH